MGWGDRGGGFGGGGWRVGDSGLRVGLLLGLDLDLDLALALALALLGRRIEGDCFES